MDDSIERYIYDVARRLPEKDRDEVSKELKSNIYDMLPDHADENAIKAVLYKLGSPASLAENYRQNPRYLISPIVYDDYIRVLKFLLPLVGLILLAIGMISGTIEAIKNASDDIAHLISKTLTEGFSLGFSGAFQALVWTTIGFIIAERTGVYTNKSTQKDWKIEDLPEILPNDKRKIPLSDSIVELVMTAVFSIAVILLCSGILPVTFIILNDETTVRTLFSAGFLTACIPAVAVIGALGIGKCIIKIKSRRWTPFVCGCVVTTTLINMGIILYLINRADLFSAEFINFVQSIDWGALSLVHFLETSGINPITILISIIIVASSLTECGKAVYKTFKK